jgi:hypothetical protein
MDARIELSVSLAAMDVERENVAGLRFNKVKIL